MNQMVFLDSTGLRATPPANGSLNSFRVPCFVTKGLKEVVDLKQQIQTQSNRIEELEQQIKLNEQKTISLIFQKRYYSKELKRAQQWQLRSQELLRKIGVYSPDEYTRDLRSVLIAVYAAIKFKNLKNTL